MLRTDTVSLIDVAIAGNAESLKKLITAKVYLNHQASNGDTALTLAIYLGHTECAKLLIAAGADPELPYYNTALDYALEKENLEIISLLLERKVSIKNPIKLYELLNKNPKLDVQQFVSILSESKAIDANSIGSTLLMKAAMKNDIQLVKTLCDAKADLDKSDGGLNTALIWAVRENNIQCVQHLITAKASLDKKETGGYTALTWAIHKGRTECAKMLIEAGANINFPPERLPLDYALCKYNDEIVFQLLCHNVLIDNPTCFVKCLKKMDKNNETTYGIYSLFLEQLMNYRNSTSKLKLMLYDKQYNEVKRDFDSLRYPKDLLDLLKVNIISAIDSATQQYLPLVLIDLISQYDNQLHRITTPKTTLMNGFFGSGVNNIPKAEPPMKTQEPQNEVIPGITR